MRTRLVGSYLFLLTLVLVALELPLAAYVAASRTDQMLLDRNADAARFASLAESALRSGEPAELDAELRRYYELYGIAVVVVDRDSEPVVVTGDRSAFSAPQALDRLDRGRAGGLVGGGHTGRWQDARLAVAVPVTTAGEVAGAILILSPTDALRARVLGVWAELAAGGLAAELLVVAVAVLLTR